MTRSFTVSSNDAMNVPWRVVVGVPAGGVRTDTLGTRAGRR